jgi:hypothetical protein
MGEPLGLNETKRPWWHKSLLYAALAWFILGGWMVPFFAYDHGIAAIGSTVWYGLWVYFLLKRDDPGSPPHR